MNNLPKRLSIILGLLVCLCSNTFAQSPAIPQQIQTVIDSIVTIDHVELGFNDVLITGSKAYTLFRKLSNLSSIPQLEQLTNYPDARIRCYAFKAICLRKNPIGYQVLLNHLADTARVKVWDYDIGYKQMVGDYMLHDLWPDSAQRRKIDHALLYGSDVKLLAKDELLNALMPLPQNYERVKEIAVKEHSEHAVLALARYRKQQDVEIIKTLLESEATEYYGLCSVNEFPDSAFYPYLVKIYERELNKPHRLNYPTCRMMHNALMKYPKPQTIDLFEKALQLNDEFKRNKFSLAIYIALRKYPDPYFDPVKSKIKLTPSQIAFEQPEFDFEKYMK